MPLHPQAQELLDSLTSAPTALNQMTPKNARLAYDKFIKKRNFNLEPVDNVKDQMIDGPNGPISMRIFWPKNTVSKVLPVFMFFHGGGFVMGSVESREPQLRKIANKVGCIVIAPRYRLAPENKFPAAHADSLTVANWVINNAQSINGNPAKLAIGGDSAGGNLAAFICQNVAKSETENFILQVLIYPTTDFLFNLDLPSYKLLDEPYFLTRSQIDWYQNQFLPDGIDRRDLRLGPALAENLSGLPPALIITAEFDPLRDDGKNYAVLLRKSGSPAKYICYDGMIHGFFHYGKIIDAADSSLKEVIKSLKKAFSS